MARDYAGILFIGDPHLASRPPGFRRDDYPAVILRKLAWCLDYARDQHLLPALLGDIFDRPRDHANWVLGELLALLGRQSVIAIYGNHDCRENSLSEDDTLSVVVKSGLLRLVDEAHVWAGVIGGTEVIIGGTPWGGRLPRNFAWQEPMAAAPRAAVPRSLFEAAPASIASTPENLPRLVFWLAHHDVRMAGYEEGRFDAFAIPGVDVVINGHIHRPLADVSQGPTLWLTPGNIARVRRESTRELTPAVLAVDIRAGQWTRRTLTVPHEPYADVFHGETAPDLAPAGASAFVQGLSELQARRTESGAGLRQFLELNQESLAPDVRHEIWKLFAETEHAPAQ